jgi:transposase
MWCVAELDEEYVARMEDVLAVYEKPLSVREPVVCIDEKPVVLHQEVRPPIAMQPGRVARRDGEYRRCGTANVFCGVQPKAGRHFTKVTHDRSSPEFADYLLDIAASYPEADTIHLVMDNLSSHTRKAVVERFGVEAGDWLWNRFTVHYTPKHGSWLNQAEIAISLFSRQCLGQRRIGDRASLRKETRAWNRRVNRDRVTIQWSFTRKQARHKLATKLRGHGTRYSSILNSQSRTFGLRGSMRVGAWKSSWRCAQKTIIFCVDEVHAARMRQTLINENKDRYDENHRYVLRIHGERWRGAGAAWKLH